MRRDPRFEGSSEIKNVPTEGSVGTFICCCLELLTSSLRLNRPVAYHPHNLMFGRRRPQQVDVNPPAP